MQNYSRRMTVKACRRGSLACAIVAVCGLGASAQPMNAPVPEGSGKSVGGNPTTEARMRVPLGKGDRPTLRVTNPNAYKSDAFEVAGYPGQFAAQAPRHTVFGQVVIIAEERAALDAAINGLRQEFGWLNPNMAAESENLPGVYRLDVRTVRNAVRVAELLQGRPGISDASVEIESAKVRRGGGGDPALSEQWHIQNFDNPGVDHRIQGVHDEGVTGQGVVVGVLEAFRGNFTSPYDPDALADPDYDYADVVHPDLFGNFRRDLSQVTDPFQIDVSHEVSVSGLIGATANNGIFGRGVAFNSGLAALRNGSQIETAEAWSHELSRIHIVNNSWGPGNENFPDLDTTYRFAVGADDFEVNIPGVSRVGTSAVAELGLARGLTQGRGGKGRVFVFASGNASHWQGWGRFFAGNAVSLPQYGLLDPVGTITGTEDDFDLDGEIVLDWRYSGMMGDRVEYWPIASNVNTLAIGAVGEDNIRSDYSTTGTALFAAAYSEGAILDANPSGAQGYGFTGIGRAMTTTSPLEAGADALNCPPALQVAGLTCSFNGTSAASPIAAGIFGLMLEANPGLSVRDIQHIVQRTSVPLNFDPQATYWTNAFGYGTTDPDDPQIQNPTFWQVNSADVLHSDEYGFGLLDAEAAVEMAANWNGLPQLFVLDSGVITDLDVSIPDATFEEIGEIGTEETPRVLFRLIPGQATPVGRTLENGVTIGGLACVRENNYVEGVEVTVTVAGAGAGDLFVVLQSPRGSVSPLAIPRADSGGVGNDLAYATYTFSTYKHWGELSGGTWSLTFQDFRPDEDTPEGTLPGDDDPGEEHITLLGPLGMPGAGVFEHSEKSVTSVRLRIFGRKSALPPAQACPPVLTSCPGDINGDGRVTTEDLALFFEWYLAGDPRADVNGDGTLNFLDILFFRSIWIPGFCDRSSGAPGGRPVVVPVSDPDVPIVRPI